MEVNGLDIKIKLKQLALSQSWLLHQINKDEYLLSKSELSLFLSGERKGHKANTILAKCNEVIDDYVRTFVRRN